MLQCCEKDGETKSVLEFFAVGETFKAFLLYAVKDGDRTLKSKISTIIKVQKLVF
jgi:hypothetical protein